MERLKLIFWRFLHRIDRSLDESVEYSLPHLPILGAIGFVGFPFYYWIWSNLFPQPYENLALRLIGSVLFFGLLTLNRWPSNYKKYIKLYWCITFTFSLPFFFTFEYTTDILYLLFYFSIYLEIYLYLYIINSINYFIYLNNIF